MSLFAHYVGSALESRDASFELVHARFVVTPALLWLAAIGVAVVLTLANDVPSRLASQAPESADPAQCFSHGA